MSTGSVSAAVTTLQSFWFIKSDQLGKVSVGKQSQASDNTAILVDGSGSLVPANWVLFDNAGFFLRIAAERRSVTARPGATSASAITSASASAVTATACRRTSSAMTQPDLRRVLGRRPLGARTTCGTWLPAMRVKVAASRSPLLPPTRRAPTRPTWWLSFWQCVTQHYFQVGAYIEHVATGLFGYGAYGKRDDNQVGSDYRCTTGLLRPMAGYGTLANPPTMATMVREGRPARAVDPARPHGALRRVCAAQQHVQRRSRPRCLLHRGFYGRNAQLSLALR